MANLTSQYNELISNYENYLNHNTTAEFYEFVVNQDECRLKWLESENECKRLQTELSTCQNEILRQERKIHEVRRHLESKMEVLNKLEADNERIELRNTSARSLINTYLNDGRINSETRERIHNVLAVLETGDNRRVSTFLRSPAGGLDTISEAGSTDLSMTQSEDDLDVSNVRSRRPRPKRPSLEHQSFSAKKQRKSGTHHSVDMLSSTDKLIAKTVVSFPKDGPIQAVSSLKTVQGGASSKSSDAHILQPTAPPLPTSESESDAGGWAYVQSPKIQHVQITGTDMATNSAQSPRFGRTLSAGGAMAMRPHAFCQKTVIKPETCEPCGKRIKFSKLALKCRDCKATCHPECRDRVPLPCVVTGTPSNKNQLGTIADYAPTTHPMVPGLVQHCVNEVEIRGLDTVGLYRVPGPEKEVKELKEKFLRGKGIPSLTKYDIHAVCGCIKDFLRSLHDPLIGRWYWRDFAVASELSDKAQKQSEIHRIVDELSPPNQDTLAFVLLHLQRIAETTAVKMPIGNLAKVFGPTIVGYSGPDIDAQTMLKETKKQQMVLETLLGMPSEFWRKYVYRQDDKVYTSSGSGTFTRAKAKTLNAAFTPQSTTAAATRSRDSARKIYFTDDSPKETPRATRQKRTFFD